jgi:hypothetical protein
LFPSNPASERGQEELEMDGFNHLGSITEGVISGVVTVRFNFRTLRVALYRDRVFGHYGVFSSSVPNA